MRRPVALLAVLALLFIKPSGVGAATHLNAAAKHILYGYVSALQHERYDDAFKLLSAPERSYFRNATNFASIFKADELKIRTFRIIGSRDAGSLGIVGLVSENISFLDQAHQAPGTATVTVPYGLIPTGSSYRIKDPFHPWKALRTTGIEVMANGLRAVVRKVSLFSGRVEIVVTFANLGDGFVTLLPYGRSVLRDESGDVYHPIESKASALTDKQLYLGLRLAPSAQYTGVLDFAITQPRAFGRLSLTIAPSLRDGADAPFALDLPAIDLDAATRPSA